MPVVEAANTSIDWNRNAAPLAAVTASSADVVTPSGEVNWTNGAGRPLVVTTFQIDVVAVTVKSHPLQEVKGTPFRSSARSSKPRLGQRVGRPIVMLTVVSPPICAGTRVGIYPSARALMSAGPAAIPPIA